MPTIAIFYGIVIQMYWREPELNENWQRGRRRQPFEHVAGPDEDE
jgi:hypothetical protein